MKKMLFLVMLCSLALALGAFACGSDDDDNDDNDDGTSDADSDSDADGDTDADADGDTDADSDSDSDVIPCDPDPPTSCDDFESMGSDAFLGCCGSDGNAYYGLGDEANCEVANDSCGSAGCCLETFDGDPAHVCCGSGSK